jgi:KDO2-lipid IV(A) lauroyltransferase
MLNKAFSYIGIAFLAVLSLLPLPVLYFLANGFYVLLYKIVGYRVKVVRENLKNAFPEKSEAERLKIEVEFYHYFANLIVEIIKMATISKSELKKRFKFKNTHLMEAYFEKGQSVLICSAHYGNWEWGTLAMGLAFSAKNFPIYKPLNNPIFDYWFRKIRSRFGNQMVAMRQTLRALQESKNQPSVFSFGNDQAPAKDESHYWTTFLNQPSSIQLGIEKIAKRTNRPIFYLKLKVLKRGYYEVDCVPLCENPKNTAEFEITEIHTRFLENIIKEEPAYWLWSHRRWKYQPKINQKIIS